MSRCRRPLAVVRPLLPCLLLAAVLAGCGNRGDLYREAPEGTDTSPAAEPAPAVGPVEEDVDEDGDDEDGGSRPG